MFGHIVHLNFNNKNSAEYKTSIGGYFSLLIKIVIYLYIGLKVISMLTLNGNENSMQETFTKYHGEVL